MSKSADLYRDRAISMFEFLRGFTKLKTKEIKTVDEFEKVIWFEEIPREPGCYCITRDSEGTSSEPGVWVSIRKPALDDPPAPPEIVVPWVREEEIANPELEAPHLFERITAASMGPVNLRLGDELKYKPKDNLDETRSCPGEDEAEGPQFQFLQDYPEVKASWANYVEEKWKPWAQRTLRLLKVQSIYSDLFSIYQRQRHMSESYETVVGVGYLTWRTPSNQTVKRHLLTMRVLLSFDAENGTISVAPDSESGRFTLEQDMLDPKERPDSEARKAIEALLDGFDGELWDTDQIGTVLKTWVHELSAEGTFEPELARQSTVAGKPLVRLAPALIFRRRLERGLEQMYEEIIAQLRSGESIPPGVAAFIGASEDDGHSLTADSDALPSAGRTEQDHILYFPMPSNQEQRIIAEKLSNNQGVLVQGPPGTGKSHTIANLIVHLIATGNRVLVTSHTSRALRALKGKLPPEIANLCVVLIGESKDAVDELEASVQEIVSRYSCWNREEAEKRITELERNLYEARRDEARITKELVELRRDETQKCKVGPYEGTPQAIAMQLGREKAHTWASVFLEPQSDEEPPLTDEEAVRILELLRAIDSAREQELSMHLPNLETLPNADAFANLVREEDQALAEYESAGADRMHPGYNALVGSTREKRDRLISNLDALISDVERSKRYTDDWVATARSQVFLRQSEAWRELLRVTVKSTDMVFEHAQMVNLWQVMKPENVSVSALKVHAQSFLGYLENGGRVGTWTRLFKPRPVREALRVLEGVYIDGRRCIDESTLRKLSDWADVMGVLEELDKSWSIYVNSEPSPPSVRVARYRGLLKALETIVTIDDDIVAVQAAMSEICGLDEPDWSNTDDLVGLRKAAVAANAHQRLVSARRPLEKLEACLDDVLRRPFPHPAVGAAIKAVTERSVEEYARVYTELADLVRDRGRLAYREELMRRLRNFAPTLAERLRRDYLNREWDKRLASFTAAWNWARASTWIKKMTHPDRQKRLSLSLEHARERRRKYLANLAAEKGWLYTFSRMTKEECQSLIAWKKEIRAIGKGTGKYAGTHRAAARKYMEGCRSVIPAWIMPIYRVAESVRPGKDSFDVAIIDEASQSGPEALFLQYIAKKVVVVGDDKQISPEHVGVNREDVEALRKEYLRDIPYSDQFGLDNSLFDLAEIKYGHRIRLREHFRCMPEIIQFCNNLCYTHEPLLPLRHYGAGRLSPVIVTRYVREGYLEGKRNGINPAEARAIVHQIKQCCQDTAYQGKTMGVISLLSTSGQAREIEGLLLKELGPEEMERRRLICGDAYDFQGDERDVIFLSMVVARSEGNRIGVLNKATDIRRFNVAVSRARDQLWLFHSVDLADLNPQDVRHTLLSYCLNPSVRTIEVGGIDVSRLGTLARDLDRTRERPPEPFDSWFEVDVFLRVAERGYRVIPQYELAGYRIDMVVEGMNGRIAVECDGDEWHGAERYEQDMMRQRELERCGYKFWRVYGSAFYRDPDEAMESLWSTLEEAGIYPGVPPTGCEGRESGPRPASGRVPSELPAGNRVGERREDVEVPGGVDRQAAATTDDDFRRAESGPGNVDVGESFTGRDNLDPKARLAKVRVQAHRVRRQGRHDARFPGVMPYQSWQERPLPDPRTAKLSEVIAGLVEIVNAEGPMVCRRAYQLYNRAAGLARLGRELRRVYNRAMYSAVRSGKLRQNDEWGTPGQRDKIVRAPGAPVVVVRERGDRDLDEIPPMEMAEVFRIIAEAKGLKLVEDNKELIFRLALEFYGVGRLAKTVVHIFRVAWEKATGEKRLSASRVGV